MAVKEQERRVADREDLKSPVEFFVDADVISARSVDVSESGIQFVTNEPVKILMRVDRNGTLEERSAEIVWARRREDGSMAYGLQYLEADTSD